MVQYCGGRTAVECAADRECLDPIDEECQYKRPCGHPDSTECSWGIVDGNQVQSTIDYFKEMQLLVPYIIYLDRYYEYGY